MDKTERPTWRRRLGRFALVNAALVLGVVLIPHRWCAWQARDWLRDDSASERRLANGVAAWVESDLSTKAFNTGDALFDGEWLFGTHLMAGLGFGQYALRHPAERAVCARRMERCIESLVSPAVQEFDRGMWAGGALDSLASNDAHHAAYLGYLNLLLGLHRRVDPESRFAALNDQITAALTRRLESAPWLLLQSYPGEVYPVDNSAVVASIALHAQVSGQPAPAVVGRWALLCRERFTDPVSGLLYQAMDPATGLPADYARGSGTALAVYFLSFADLDLSAELYAAARKQLCGGVLGFGGVREYARGVRGDGGDIDSGPVLFGFGLSATGFLMAGSRIHHDDIQFRRLYATAHLCGAPVVRGERLNFVTGGPLGDTILFAMLTARGPERGQP